MNSNTKKKKKSGAASNTNANGFGLNGHDFGIGLHNMPANTPANKNNPLLVATKSTLEAFGDDVGSLWCGTIPVLDEPPSAMTFLRDYVSVSRPCIIRNAILVRQQQNHNNHQYDNGDINSNESEDSVSRLNDHNRVPLQLTLDDIVALKPDLEVVVDATPDGHGDCIRTVQDEQSGGTHRMFVTPEPRTMTLAEFRTQLRQGRRQQRQEKDDLERKLQEEYEQQQQQQHLETRGRGRNVRINTEQSISQEREPLDGKGIYPLKPTASSKNNAFDFQELYKRLPPTPTCGGENPTINMDPSSFASCNPMAAMDELVLPCVMEFMDGVSGKNDDNDNTTSSPRDSNDNRPSSCLYYSRQNDCLRTELSPLYEQLDQVPANFRFAQEAFNTGPPEAVNLWMGDERAVSSMHKDPYQNLFYVASGEKSFTLCPPADAPFLYEQDFLSGAFDSGSAHQQQQSSMFSPRKRQWTVRTGYEDNQEGDDDDDVVLNANTPAQEKQPSTGNVHPKSPLQRQVEDEQAHRPAYVRWIEADVAALTDPHCEMVQHKRFPLLKYAHPIHNVTVRSGELLYLPALWFHRVTQTRETIAINYWFNMNFNSPQWCYFQLLQQLSLTSHASPPPAASAKSGGAMCSPNHYLEEKEENKR